MRSKDRQLNPDEEDETREIASVHIHIERAIERVKNCNILNRYYQILCQKIFIKFGKSAVYWPILTLPSNVAQVFSVRILKYKRRPNNFV